MEFNLSLYRHCLRQFVLQSIASRAGCWISLAKRVKIRSLSDSSVGQQQASQAGGASASTTPYPRSGAAKARHQLHAGKQRLSRGFRRASGRSLRQVGSSAALPALNLVVLACSSLRTVRMHDIYRVEQVRSCFKAAQHAAFLTGGCNHVPPIVQPVEHGPQCDQKLK